MSDKIKSTEKIFSVSKRTFRMKTCISKPTKLRGRTSPSMYGSTLPFLKKPMTVLGYFNLLRDTITSASLALSMKVSVFGPNTLTNTFFKPRTPGSSALHFHNYKLPWK